MIYIQIYSKTSFDFIQRKLYGNAYVSFHIGIISSQSVVETLITNSSLPLLIQLQCVDIVQSFWKVWFIKVINVKCVMLLHIKDAFHRQDDASKKAWEWHRPCVIVNCLNFIGLLDPCLVIPLQINSKIAKLAHIYCVFDHKVHLIQMKQCMRSVWSKFFI